MNDNYSARIFTKTVNSAVYSSAVTHPFPPKQLHYKVHDKTTHSPQVCRYTACNQSVSDIFNVT